MPPVDEVILIHSQSNERVTLTSDLYVVHDCDAGCDIVLFPIENEPPWIPDAEVVAAHADGSVEASFTARDTDVLTFNAHTALTPGRYRLLTDDPDFDSS